jgi:crossover junction endodeoxyribonuclease RusA
MFAKVAGTQERKIEMVIEFRIDNVEPLPKQSFRYRKGGGYTDEHIKMWEACVGTSALAYMVRHDIDELQGDLKAEIHFVRSNRRRVDIDNLSKAVLDAMNGIAYQDDRQIVDIHLTKTVGEVPGIRVKVEEI